MPYNINVFQPYLLPIERRIALPWTNKINIPNDGKVSDDDDDQNDIPINTCMHYVHMIGLANFMIDTAVSPGFYNCAAFVLGINNRLVNFQYYLEGEVNPRILKCTNELTDLQNIRNWVNYIGITYAPLYGIENIVPTLQNKDHIEILNVEVRLPKSEGIYWNGDGDLDDIFNTDTHGVFLLNTDIKYVPQVNDIAVYTIPETEEVEEEEVGNVSHVALYTNLNDITGETVQLGPRWYSKCGKEYLVAHSLERLSDQYPRTSDFTLQLYIDNYDGGEDKDFRGTDEAMERVLNEKGYGKLVLIIRRHP